METLSGEVTGHEVTGGISHKGHALEEEEGGTLAHSSLLVSTSDDDMNSGALPPASAIVCFLLQAQSQSTNQPINQAPFRLELIKL